jgi:hypothetical protein
MKRLIFLAFIGATIWYGWHHYGGLSQGPSNVAVIQNSSGRVLERVRLTVAGQTFVKEVIEDGSSEEIPFRISRDSEFKLRWQSRGKEGEPEWNGGSIVAGPMVTRQHFTVLGDGGVIWSAEALPSAAAK